MTPADHEDAGLDRDVGQGYPEEAPAGTNQPGSDGDAERDRAPHEAEDAPDTSSPEDGDPGQATGNPHAAGS